MVCMGCFISTSYSKNAPRMFSILTTNPHRKTQKNRGQRSEIRGQRSEVGDQKSEIREQRTEGWGRQRSEVRSRRSEDGGWTKKQGARGPGTEDGGRRSEDSSDISRLIHN